MRNYCKTIGALAAVSALVAGNASAEVEYQLHTGYSSEYLFRGINLGQDLIEVGADVKTQAWGLDWSAGAWYANCQNTHAWAGPNNESFDELDLYGEVAKDFGFLTGSVGYISRQFSNNFIGKHIDNSQEVYFGVSRELCYGIKADLTYYWDVESDNDGYSELGLSRAWELTPCVSLNWSSKFGYLAEEGDFTHWGNRLTLDWGFAEHAKLSPFIEYDLSLSEGGRNYNGPLANYDGAKDQLIGGVMLSVGF